MLNTLGILCWLWLFVAAHEASHLVVAYWLDRPVSGITIGNGPVVLRQWYWRGIHCTCKLLPFSGEVRLVARSRRRWINLAITGAGPTSNLVLALGLAMLGLQDVAHLSLYLGIYNLMPVGKLDGAEIWREMRRVRPTEI